MRIANLKISTRLTLGFACIGAMLVLMGFLFLGRIHSVQMEFRRMMQDHYPRVVALHQIRSLTMENASTLRNLFILVSEPEIKKQIGQLEKTSASIVALLKQVQAQSAPRDRAVIEQVVAARTAYLARQGAMLDAFRQGFMNDAGMLLLGDVQRTQSAYFEALDAAIGHEEAGMQAADRQVEAAASGAKLLTGLLLMVASATAALVGVGIMRSINRPLGQALEVARAVAGGDLTRDIEVRGRDEIAELLTALGDMQQQLQQIVRRLRQGSESVATASSEIAFSNQDLATRTESQAGAVERTSASMDKLHAMVAANAERARQANELAHQACRVAEEGGQVVTQVVTTVAEINDSAHKIADIINVIDGIAFQTNILALNAAVEAARAGEQGRGFAVVAGEVRALAGRSAGAAKEIKSLISTSVERVWSGAGLVDQASAAMHDIIASIRGVNDIMAEIDASSAQQAQGMTQIAQAVAQIDAATQQNATLVEEMAAAAAKLKRLADGQMQTVGVFALESSLPLPRLGYRDQTVSST